MASLRKTYQQHMSHNDLLLCSFELFLGHKECSSPCMAHLRRSLYCHGCVGEQRLSCGCIGQQNLSRDYIGKQRLSRTSCGSIAAPNTPGRRAKAAAASPGTFLQDKLLDLLAAGRRVHCCPSGRDLAHSTSPLMEVARNRTVTSRVDACSLILAGRCLRMSLDRCHRPSVSRLEQLQFSIVVACRAALRNGTPAVSTFACAHLMHK